MNLRGLINLSAERIGSQFPATVTPTHPFSQVFILWKWKRCVESIHRKINAQQSDRCPFSGSLALGGAWTMESWLEGLFWKLTSCLAPGKWGLLASPLPCLSLPDRRDLDRSPGSLCGLPGAELPSTAYLGTSTATVRPQHQAEKSEIRSQRAPLSRDCASRGPILSGAGGTQEAPALLIPLVPRASPQVTPAQILAVPAQTHLSKGVWSIAGNPGTPPFMALLFCWRDSISTHLKPHPSAWLSRSGSPYLAAHCSWVPRQPRWVPLRKAAS